MKNYLLGFLFVLTATFAQAKSDDLTDLSQAIQQATTEQKALFIMYGREACGNCTALKGMVASKDVRLPKSSFIVVNLNCDDPTQKAAFREKYTVTGNTLPFVVIAKPDGTQISSRSGGGSAETYNDFIRDAKKELK